MLFPLLLLLVFLRLYAIALLHFSETKGICHKRLVSGLLLLLDGEERILANFGSEVTSRVGILDGNEVFVGSANLCFRVSFVNP